MKVFVYWWFLFFVILFTPLIVLSDDSKTAKSRTIRDIHINVREVFDDNDLAWPYRAANALKINTKRDIVKRELLFKEGDEYDPFVIQESGRNLRSLPFLREINIVEIPDGEFVDIVISVQDTWTLIPEIGLSSGGGTSRQSLGLVEGNFLGLGKRVEGLVAEDEGRRKYEAVFDDRRFLGTLQRFSVGHFERSDGRESVLSWGKPFRSLVDKSAWFSNVNVSDLIGRQFDEGSERFIFREERINLIGGYTISDGLPSELLSRYTFGYQFINNEFSEATNTDFDSINIDPDNLQARGGMLAEDRRFSGPVFSYQRISPDFISLNFVDFFDRVQDFNLGNEFLANVHIAPQVLGSDRDALIMRLSDTVGKRLGSEEFIRGQVGANARMELNRVRHIVLSAQGRYYNVLGPQYFGKLFLGQHTLAAGALYESGFSLDNDTEFLLGAGSGLRGYKDRAFSGNHRFSVNLEDRFHVIDDVAKLASVGGAFFLDAGSIATDTISDFVDNGLYANVGVGLRLGLTRSSGGTVVRMDIAFPLRDGPDGSMRFEPQLLITTGQMFGAALRSDAPGLQTPAISAGFQQ